VWSDVYCTLNLRPKEVVATTNAQERKKKWKKLKKVDPSATIEYYGNKGTLRGNDVVQQRNRRDLTFNIAKCYIALYTMNDPWLCFLVLQRDSKVTFLTQNNLSRRLSPLSCKLLSNIFMTLASSIIILKVSIGNPTWHFGIFKVIPHV
jgi:uncharacterized protein YmfQ (DUF2313 family)